jgi:hypothetical protein
MSDVITVIIGDKQFDAFEKAADYVLQQLQDAPNRAAQQVTRELKFTLQRVAAKMRELHSAGWNGQLVNGSEYLQKRSGDGLQSILDSIRVTGGQLSAVEGSIGTGTMSIHETGGVISAVNSQYLTIPLPAALDNRGVPLRASARDWENTFVQRSRRGNLIIFQKRGKQVVPLYLLKPSVKIKPRLHLEDTIMGELPYFQERLLDIIAKEISF